MQYVHFLNLEYFLLLVYRVFTGTNVDVSQIPQETLRIMTYIGWAGLLLSIVFFAGFIYARRAMHAIEHEGWHRRDEDIHALEHKAQVHEAMNPQWEHVIALANGPSESDWRRAIIEADIMLDMMLTERGYHGTTLGDKLKTANPLQFTTLQLAWAGHKIRNQIAHAGSEFHLTEREARAAIDNYRRVFEEFNYL